MSIARRSFLQSFAGSLGLWAGQSHADVPHAETTPFTVAFLTDTHLPAGKPAVATRVAELIKRIQERPMPPELVVFGGDNVFAVDGNQNDDQTDEQFQLWKQSVMDPLQVPSVSVIGNHDIRWKERSTDHPEAFREKNRAVEAFGIPARFYRAEHGGWTFLLLDTFQWTGCELDSAVELA